MVDCPNGHPNPESASWCVSCGVELVSVCSNGHNNQLDSTFCCECGVPVISDLVARKDSAERESPDLAATVPSTAKPLPSADDASSAAEVRPDTDPRLQKLSERREAANSTGQSRRRHQGVKARRLLLGGLGALVVAAMIHRLIWAVVGVSNPSESPSTTLAGLQEVGPPLGTGSPTTTNPPAPSFASRWVIGLTTPGGYTMTDTVSVEKPEPYLVKSNVNGLTTAGTACSLNSQTDAVIPITIDLTNTTNRVDDQPGLELSGFGLISVPNAPVSTLTFEFGKSCYGQDGNSSIDLYAPSPLTKGDSSVLRSFVDITNFFTPVNPTSNAALLANATVSIPQSFAITTTTGKQISYTVTRVTGPRVTNTGGGWRFSLGGS